MMRVLDGVAQACNHEKWQVRHAGVNFLRCFQGAHKFLFRSDHTEKSTAIVTDLLADERREVSSAAMAALTGILAACPAVDVARMVRKYAKLAESSKMRKARKGTTPKSGSAAVDDAVDPEKERKRSRNQQVSVFFLCATVLARPYDTPAYVPEALAAISKHSFERNAPLGVRDTVKRCCAEYKRTHMSDNWEEHRRMFTQEQLEAFEDVVSTPHYYA
jgi:proteasome activator subunit 4